MSKNDYTQVFYLHEQVVDINTGDRVDKKGVPPVGCIALVWNEDGKVARGISICSEVDNWNREDARTKAIARARKAMGTGKNTMPIGVAVNTSHGEVVRTAGLNFLAVWQARFGMEFLPVHKSAANPVLTPFETKVLQAAKDRVTGKAPVLDTAAPVPA